MKWTFSRKYIFKKKNIKIFPLRAKITPFRPFFTNYGTTVFFIFRCGISREAHNQNFSLLARLDQKLQPFKVWVVKMLPLLEWWFRPTKCPRGFELYAEQYGSWGVKNVQTRISISSPLRDIRDWNFGQ